MCPTNSNPKKLGVLTLWERITLEQDILWGIVYKVIIVSPHQGDLTITHLPTNSTKIQDSKKLIYMKGEIVQQ